MAYKKLKYYFDKELLIMLADKIESVADNFDSNSFINNTVVKLEPLELKDRIRTIATSLHDFLPDGYPNQLKLLISILGPENKGAYGTFNDYFWTWPIATFIELYGLEHEEESMSGIEYVTKRGTGEFAIRPFLRQNPSKLLQVMHTWSQDQNHHVRRLSSEGLRPLLPWSQKLKLFIENPNPVRPIIENLKNDPSKYVQTSVANHINDYLKVNHGFGIGLIKDWSQNPKTNTRWIIKHAIRNYRKKQEPWALELTARMNQVD